MEIPATISKVNDILRRNQLSVTGSRKSILDLFIRSNGALAHGDIEKMTGEKFDRVTVYRTLQSFMEKGIIHTIPTSDILFATRYARTIVRRDITTITMFILFVQHAVVLPV